MSADLDRELARLLRKLRHGSNAEIDNDIAVTLKALKQELKQSLEAEMPEIKVGTEKIPLNDIERGFNVAVEDAQKAINQVFGEDKT
jgi:hypothetical protein